MTLGTASAPKPVGAAAIAPFRQADGRRMRTSSAQARVAPQHHQRFGESKDGQSLRLDEREQNRAHADRSAPSGDCRSEKGAHSCNVAQPADRSIAPKTREYALSGRVVRNAAGNANGRGGGQKQYADRRIYRRMRALGAWLIRRC
jgi:hypothetical protein